MTLGNVTPKTGGRMHAVLDVCHEQSAEYRVTLRAADGEWTGRASVTTAGSADLQMSEAGAPDWLTALATTVLRTACRGLAMTQWPRRVTRWRAARD